MKAQKTNKRRQAKPIFVMEDTNKVEVHEELQTPIIHSEEVRGTEAPSEAEQHSDNDADTDKGVEQHSDNDADTDKGVEQHSDNGADKDVEIRPDEAAAEGNDAEPTLSETPEESPVDAIEPPVSDEAAQAEAADETPEVMTQESLEEAYDHSLKSFTEGEIVKGTVVEVSSDEVMIDIGFKSEGYIEAAEFERGEGGLPSVKVGDQIDVYIVRREDADGQIVLSKKIADQTLIWDEIAKAHEDGQVVQGQIVERIKGGLRVNVGSLRAFLPASQIELRPVQDFDRYVGQTLEMKVVKLSKRRRNIVLSRRILLEEQTEKRKGELLNTLEVNQIRPGVVKNITSFGAFVDLGGVDGLLHKTDMSWKKVNHPSEVVSIGDEVEVMVIGVDHENEKVSLGLKQKTIDPWGGIEERYPIGSTVRGQVVNIVNYGAFLELEEGVEGLIHVSEMSWTRRNVAPSKIVNKGDEIEAVVLEIDQNQKRISLGIKQLQENPWELLEQKYPIGTRIVGRVRNLTDFGAFVEIEEGIDGLIHTSDLSWVRRDMNPKGILKEGEEVEVQVLQIDPSERKVSLGLKQVDPDPWSLVPEKYKVGTVVRGKIVNITHFGAFAKLEDGIEGLIHISELSERRIEKPEEIVSLNEELDLKVINLDSDERRIGLSLKAAISEQERASVTEYQQRQPPPPKQPPPQQYQQRPQRRAEDSGDQPTTALGALLKEELEKSES